MVLSRPIESVRWDWTFSVSFQYVVFAAETRLFLYEHSVIKGIGCKCGFG